MTLSGKPKQLICCTVKAAALYMKAVIRGWCVIWHLSFLDRAKPKTHLDKVKELWYIKLCSILHNLGGGNMDNYDQPMFTALVEISRLANTLQSVMDMGMEDITSRQWLPLMILGRSEGPLNLNQLAEKCGITRQSAKQLVDKLDEKELIALQKAEKDRRNISIVITEKGRNWGMVNLERNTHFVGELFEDISKEDIQTFAGVQQKLLLKLTDIKNRTKGE